MHIVVTFTSTLYFVYCSIIITDVVGFFHRYLAMIKGF